MEKYNPEEIYNSIMLRKPVDIEISDQVENVVKETVDNIDTITNKDDLLSFFKGLADIDNINKVMNWLMGELMAYKKSGYSRYEAHLNLCAGKEIIAGLDQKKITAMAKKGVGSILRSLDLRSFKLGYNIWRRANRVEGAGTYYKVTFADEVVEIKAMSPSMAETVRAYENVTSVEESTEEEYLEIMSVENKNVKAVSNENGKYRKDLGQIVITFLDEGFKDSVDRNVELRDRDLSYIVQTMNDMNSSVSKKPQYFFLADDNEGAETSVQPFYATVIVLEKNNKDYDEHSYYTVENLKDVLNEYKSQSSIVDLKDNVNAALLDIQEVDSFEKDILDISKKYEITVEDVMDNIDTYILPATVSASRKKRKVKASAVEYFKIDDLDDDDFNEVYEEYGYTDDEGLSREQKKALLVTEMDAHLKEIESSYASWKSSKESEGENWGHIIEHADYYFDNALERYIEWEDSNPVQLNEDVSDEKWDAGLEYYMESYYVQPSAMGHGFIFKDGSEMGASGGDHSAIPAEERMKDRIVTSTGDSESINLRLLTDMTFPQWGAIKSLISDTGSQTVYYDVYDGSGNSVDSGEVDAEDFVRTFRQYVSANKKVKSIKSVLKDFKPAAELKDTKDVHIVALDSARALLEIADGGYEIPETGEMVLIFESGTDALEMANASFPEYEYPPVLKDIVEKESNTFNEAETVEDYIEDFAGSDRYNEMDMALNVGLGEIEKNEEDEEIIL